MFIDKGINQKKVLEFVQKFKEIGYLQQFAVVHNNELKIKFAVEPYKEEDIKQLINLSNYFVSPGESRLAGYITFGDWFDLYGLSEIFIFDILRNYNQLNYRPNLINTNSFYKKYIRRFAMIQTFSANKNYSEEEKIKYLKLYGIETTPEELSKVFDKAYIARKVIAEPFYEFYHSKEY
jgi:hypothetical protein